MANIKQPTIAQLQQEIKNHELHIEELQIKLQQIEEISRLAGEVEQIEVAHIFFNNINELSDL
jgi:predicted RNase H-like nuclease (RuvC/YqgF family)